MKKDFIKYLLVQLKNLIHHPLSELLRVKGSDANTTLLTFS
jgi:hypothetical protein